MLGVWRRQIRRRQHKPRCRRKVVGARIRQSIQREQRFKQIAPEFTIGIEGVQRARFCKARGVERNDFDIGTYSGKVDRQKTRKDVARLADHGAWNLIIVNAVTGAHSGSAVAEWIPGEGYVRRDVVDVGLKDPAPSAEIAFKT